MVEYVRGRNQNMFDEVETRDYTVGPDIAITIAPPNVNRTHLSVQLAPGTDDAVVYIRYYPAAKDNFKHGEKVLVRKLSGNDSVVDLRLVMNGDHPYTGEISAITAVAEDLIFVTEMVPDP